MDFSQNLKNAAVFGQGNLDLVREKSGKCQGILLAIICGNPAGLLRWLERPTCDPGVVGSSPTSGGTFPPGFMIYNGVRIVG